MHRPIAALAVAAVVWNGPVDFSAGQPRVAVAQTGPLSGLPAGGLARGDAPPAAADGGEPDAGGGGAGERV